MADQTLPLNVSYEMKADDERQNCVGMESDEELCSSSSDSAEELYSSSTTDAYRNNREFVPSEVRSLLGRGDIYMLNKMELPPICHPQNKIS